MQIINKHSLTVVEVTTRERREEYSGENWIELQSHIAAIRAENAELREALTAIVTKIEAGYKGFAVNGELHENARAALAKYEVTK